MEDSSAQFAGVLETSLYVRDLDGAAAFYGEVLGLRLIGEEPGRSLFYRIASGSLLLLFVAEATAQGGSLPGHGASGPGHCCLRASQGCYRALRERLASAGVDIEHDAKWPAGQSFFFRDPDGNLLEIAECDIWPR
ncbi:MAG: VOC family protein [Deltaproteobacteria bacterium]|nr:VOC family protein [Deltaproteobacteria bacterium]